MPLHQLGPYKLEKIIGRGGMGAVYAGVNEATGERAAVKVLSAHLADDPGFRERFKIEVESLKRLLHPNIVQLVGYGEEDGHLFYVMELVNGRSLQDELAAGRRFTWREVARIGIAVAQALKHAHDRGIIHRDLKPANLLLDEQEHVKLTDFGIAKLYGGANVTADGGVLGTADYMSPEQADGKQVTARCDLYALGSVMFALLAGRPPFAGRTIVEVIAALKRDTPVPIRRLAPDTPAEFEAIIQQLLEKEPQNRIPTALALANRLKAMEHALSPVTRPLSAGELRGDEAASADLAPDAAPPVDAPPRRAARASAVTAPLEDLTGHAPRDLPALVTSGGSVLPGGIAAQGERAADNAGSAASPVPLVHTAKTAGAEAAAKAPESPARTTFTTVSQSELRGGQSADAAAESGARQWMAIGGLMLLAALGIGAIVLLAARQPSADQLFARIQAAAEEGPDRLIAAEPEVRRFLESYPGDPRSTDVKRWQEDLELFRLARRFELRARRPGGVEGLLPVERAYLEAVQRQASDPAAALRQFEALVAVFGGPADADQSPAEKRTTAQCLGLAQRQIERLKEVAAALESQERQAVARQLERAEILAAADHSAAVAIWEGVVTLYADKPWAADLVARARASLAKPR